MPSAAGHVRTRDTRFVDHRQSLARRMIAARAALNGPLSPGLLHDTALSVLLLLFVADDNAATAETLQSSLPVAATIDRWLAVLQHEGLAAVSGEDAALTPLGHDKVSEALDAIIRLRDDPLTA